LRQRPAPRGAAPRRPPLLGPSARPRARARHREGPRPPGRRGRPDGGRRARRAQAGPDHARLAAARRRGGGHRLRGRRARRRRAREAAALVEVEYEVLEPVTDPFAALAEGAPRVHEDRDNLLSTSIVRRGDVNRALAAAAHVITETFRTQFIEHAFLEPESALAEPAGEGVHVYSQGQGVWEDRRQIASFLGLPEERVRVTQVANGGAFGAKEDLNVQCHAALIA